jgi:hypothetical protein
MTGTDWANAITDLRRDLENLSRRANELRVLPKDLTTVDLVRAWGALAGGSAPSGPTAASYVLDNLRAIWGQLGSGLANSFGDTLRMLSGRLQGGPDGFPSTDFGPRGVAMFHAADGCTPSNIHTAQQDSYAIGYFDALAADHPLRQAMPDRDRLYWLEDATWDNPRYAYFLGGVVLNADGSFSVPDWFEVPRVVQLTTLAADAKRFLRRQKLAERAREEEERRKRDEERARAIRWNSMSEDDKVKIITDLERQVAELKEAKQTAATP